ncbi:MAG: DUF4416 family protein [Nitrospirota bacterium]
MGKPSPPEHALLFVGTLYQDEKYLSIAKEKLNDSFGEVIMESPSLEWNYSNYYRDELGWPIKRTFIFFKNTINPEILADIKLITNDIEHQLSTKGRRNINIDPGYLTLSKVVLASTKNYAHRIYLGKGIYGEVTLIYREGRYNPHLYTYRDYQDRTYIEIFMNARAVLKKMSS